MIHYIIGFVATGIIPICLIWLLSKLDRTDNSEEATNVEKIAPIGELIKLGKKEVILLIGIAVLYTVITNTLFNYELLRYINMSILTGYLVVMSYTDQKSKALFTILSVLMLIIETVWLIATFDNVYITKYDLLLIPIMIGLYLLSRFRLLGFGDVLIYAVIAVYELTYSLVSFWDLLFNILVANVLFVLVTSIIRMKTKDDNKNQPFTLYIAIATFISNLILI